MSKVPNATQRRPRSWLRRFVRDERGAAAMEFAIIVPLLLTLVLGIIDIGRLLFVTSSLTAAAREAGRSAAVLVDPTTGAALTTVRTRIANTFQPMGGAAVPSNAITMSAVDANGDITVTITGYTYVPITPFAQFVGLGTITITRRAVFRWERAS